MLKIHWQQIRYSRVQSFNSQSKWNNPSSKFFSTSLNEVDTCTPTVHYLKWELSRHGIHGHTIINKSFISSWRYISAIHVYSLMHDSQFCSWQKVKKKKKLRKKKENYFRHSANVCCILLEELLHILNEIEKWGRKD